jgi:hypothetical protein
MKAVGWKGSVVNSLPSIVPLIFNSSNIDLQFSRCAVDWQSNAMSFPLAEAWVRSSLQQRAVSPIFDLKMTSNIP